MDYKSTLNLPKTAFAMKADLPKREPEFLANWQKSGLYEKIRKERASADKFILHDGPPYANGDIHIGHALNKILKDIIVRYKTMQGFNAPYVPGWDCHGMPIEHQLFKELKITKHEIAQTDFRKKARAYAQRYVDTQREQFKRLGVLGDWENPYLTMAPEYEMTILHVFRELWEKGFIVYDKKPVHWCASCETALAEAEVEYENKQDASIFVKFPVINPPKLLPETLLGAFKRKDRLAVAVWTTTPWTLPANVALCFHPDEQYVVLHDADWEHNLIVARALAPKLAMLLKAKTPLETGGGLGRDFKGMTCAVPFGERTSVVVTDPSVSMEEGTGVVHIAPGHGDVDYLIGKANQLEILSPVGDKGLFTQEAPEFLRGQHVFKANALIVEDLKRRGLLLKEEPVDHSYPHCWRCKNPLIFRATPQWFLRVSDAFREQLLKSAKTVTWIPEYGAKRMSGMLESRPDWCLSRQRYWGSPIPVFHCKRCEKPLLENAVFESIESYLSEHGIDSWFSATPQQIAPKAACPHCKKADELQKDTNILDVWFDSGVSHRAVLQKRKELCFPAELYLEGSDQHRGWFQVSLIPAVALLGQPPFKAVLTHGFVMDGQGRKMSKSLGNVIAPQDVMQRYGADILRLWVAFSDYREDVRISEEILAQVAESYRKIRNTLRYLLANLYDFNPLRDRVSVDQGPPLDRWINHRSLELLETVTAAYENYQFHEVAKAAYQFCVVDLSSFYLDVLKDRLYTESAGELKRRCAQTVLYDILSTLVKALAPILAITTEEVWQLMRSAGWVPESSVHLASYPKATGGRLSEEAQKQWPIFLSLRDVAMKALEEKRGQEVIGSPLEAKVTLLVSNDAMRRLCEEHKETLAETFVVSQVAVEQDEPPCKTPNAQLVQVPGSAKAVQAGLVDLRVDKAPGSKCQRCWRYLASVGKAADHPQLCERCVRVVTQTLASGESSTNTAGKIRE